MEYPPLHECLISMDDLLVTRNQKSWQSMETPPSKIRCCSERKKHLLRGKSNCHVLMTGGFNQAPFLREPRGFHGHGCAPIAGGFVWKSHRSKWMMTCSSPMTKRKPPSLTGASFPNEMENCPRLENSTRKIPRSIIILDCGFPQW